jgi:DNA end-binding protein Ku
MFGVNVMDDITRRTILVATAAGGNVVDLMEALRRSVGGAEPAKTSKASKKPRKSASGQKEMLMTIEGKKVKDTPKKSASKQRRKSA